MVPSPRAAISPMPRGYRGARHRRKPAADSGSACRLRDFDLIGGALGLKTGEIAGLAADRERIGTVALEDDPYVEGLVREAVLVLDVVDRGAGATDFRRRGYCGDRKSTRLNSSH